MSDTDTTSYLDRLLALYEEKLKRFRFSLTILLVGTIIFFFLIFFPYITLIGNQESCRVNQLDCPQLEQSGLKERVSDVTTSWGNIPVSTAEVVAFFPVGVACGFIAVSSQLQDLMRLRRAITQQIRGLESPIDVTLIAPLLIDPKQDVGDQMLGVLILLFPSCLALFSVNLILVSLEAIKNSLPYNQNVSFYYGVYLISVLLILCGLLRIGWTFLRSLAIERA